MSQKRFACLLFMVCIVVAPVSSCRQDGPDEGSGGESPKAKSSIAAVPSPTNPIVPSEGGIMRLEGLILNIPSGWGSPSIKSGQFSKKTILALPKEEGDDQGGTVEITHFPGMKGMDEQNIQRWLASVTRADGTPYTRETANVQVLDIGQVRLTIVDLTGTVRTSMFGPNGGLVNHRMIAAIIDHSRGPHFFKAVGASSTMAKWAQSIKTFLNSATVSVE